jgi:drug/metabolite transporter (DMT)-like permease
MTNLRAIGLVLTAMLFFSIQDVIVKLTAEDVSLWQMQVIRSFAILAILAALLGCLKRGDELTPTSSWTWPILRALFMAFAYLCFYGALPYISLAKAASAFFISPMLITVLAAIFLGEGIGPRRIIAVIVGFAGVLFIVQPGLEGWSPMTLLPVAAAGAYAAGVILTRWRCQQDPGFSLTMMNGLVNAVIGVAGVILIPLLPVTEAFRAENAFLMTGWLDTGPAVLGLVVITAVTHIIGTLTSVKAYQIGEASRLAPFEYTYLVIMGIFGFLIWNEAPDDATLIGMSLICASGAFVAWREGRPPRPRAQQNAEIPWTPEHLDDDPSMPSAPTSPRT